MSSQRRLRPFHVQLAARLLAEVEQGRRPADQILADCFRENRQMGARDRRLVSETVYDVLRNRRLLQWCAGENASPLTLVLCSLGQQGMLDEGLRARFEPLPPACSPGQAPPPTLPVAIRHSLPDWLWQHWQRQYGETDAARLAAAINRPAPVDLRVNTLKTDRDTLLRQLAEQGVEAVPTPFSPLGLRLSCRRSLKGLAAFRQGLFEFQDEGSQLIGIACEVQPGMQVLDLCAGGGGKTLQLAAAMGDRGEIIACEVAAKRLANLPPRLDRAGVRNVTCQSIRHERDPLLKRWRGRFDVLLVDAPCSGIGTLRRNPELKWRQPDLNALHATQSRLLEAAAPLLAPGGRLVYATCSLLDPENGAVIEAFRAAKPSFEPASLSLPASLTESAASTLALRPDLHGCDGFFMAAMRGPA